MTGNKTVREKKTRSLRIMNMHIPYHIMMILWSFISVFPLFFLVINTFKVKKEIYINFFGLPQKWTLENYTSLMGNSDFFVYFRNSFLIVVVSLSRPVVLSEVEPYADAVLVTFGVQNQAVLDIVSGAAEPSGLLPMQLPADMRTVEEQQEDVPHDMRPLVDADGHAWDFAYGLNWAGVIDDARTAKYRKP